MIFRAALASAVPQPDRNPDCLGRPWCCRRSSRRFAMMELRSLDMIGRREIGRHLFGSLRSPLFGISVRMIVCQSLVSHSGLVQYRVRRWRRCVLDFISIALKASGGIESIPGALPSFNFWIANCNSAKFKGLPQQSAGSCAPVIPRTCTVSKYYPGKAVVLSLTIRFPASWY